ncbi:MAG: Asp-tRNA(Asn)/Glu-tRNA(Gln) amidotransferase subunit GatC [Proteobacteria bacterium]|nr:Asp-tRNA(Asn)/Glu-tRNA(Gln) amidotransferase subunit GatC [Pseudomonadota bacterium]
MSITEKDVEYVAGLARLNLKEGEVNTYTAQLQRILSYVEKLSELDTEGVEPTAYSESTSTPMREDVVHDSLARDEALKNAPSIERGCFKVPKIIE